MSLIYHDIVCVLWIRIVDVTDRKQLVFGAMAYLEVFSPSLTIVARGRILVRVGYYAFITEDNVYLLSSSFFLFPCAHYHVDCLLVADCAINNTGDNYLYTGFIHLDSNRIIANHCA